MASVAIYDAFTNPDSPVCYTTAQNVWKQVKKKFRSLKLEDVEDVLHTIPAYTLHKPRRIKFKRLKTIPRGFMTDVQVDLADFQKVADKNDNFKYMLVGVDVLSRRVFAAPTKSKASNHMIASFKRLFRQMPTLPDIIFSDKGVEFEAGAVKNYLKNLDILKHVAQSPDVKAAIAERFIRTVKGRLYKYFSENETIRWVDVIAKIVNAINHTRSRVTGMKPIDVNYNNANALWDKLYRKSMDERYDTPKNRYKKGDTVRISKAKKHFEKSYLPNYTDEVFVVDKAKKGKTPTYDLKDKQGEEIKGIFYKEELSKATHETGNPKILKVLKTRTRRGKKEYFVKLSSQNDEIWVKEEDLQ